MSKYYRVKQDTFLWDAGAIIKSGTYNSGSEGYTAIQDIWDAVPTIGGEYISSKIVEHEGNSAFFERVYPDTLNGKIFKTKDKILDFYKESFKE